MTTDPHLDDLLDIVIGVVVADALTNENGAESCQTSPRREVSTCSDKIPESTSPAN